LKITLYIVVALCFGSALGLSSDFDDYSSVIKLGGDTSTTLSTPSSTAYRNPAQNLSAEDLKKHMTGDGLFEHKFSDDRDRKDYGLGPAYNHVACMGCHVIDGRGALPVLGKGDTWKRIDGSAAIFLRVSIEDGLPRTFDEKDQWGSPIAVPGFGKQLFHMGSYGLRNDIPGVGLVQMWVRLEWSDFTYPDGQKLTLRKPIFKVENAYDSAVGDRLHQSDVRFSPRMTPGIAGLGLLEAIREQDILDLAKRDLSSWGIHGHPNWVIDREKEMSQDPKPVSLGRFGLKANTPSVFHQALGALNGDLGVTNPAFLLENIWGTSLFESFKPKWKESLEATQDQSDALVFYSQTLAVPSRRNVLDPQVQTGAKMFQMVGCANCHQPSFVTGSHKITALSNQQIYPFTDMLLHDMGEGLADGRTDFYASGSEWRTPPLWGIGLVQVVNLRAGYLHDGRARTLEEAILWHGGEAEISRDRFAALDANRRAALIRFLKSL
jgi:CxxC motif-containing protein (DUF1111 family)